jgi:hypothetical protein
MKRILVAAILSGGIILLQYLGSLIKTSLALALSFAVIGLGFMAGNHARTASRQPVATLGHSSASHWLRRLVFLLVGIAVYKLAYDWLDMFPSEPKFATVQLVKEVCLYGAFLVLLARFGPRQTADCISALGLGIAGYGLVNMLAFQLGIIPEQLTFQAFDSISSGRERMLAPFGPGLNSFGNMIATGMLFCLAGAWEFWKTQRRENAILAGLGCLACLGILIRVELRSALIALVFGVLWQVARGARMRRFLRIGSALTMIVLPIMAGTVLFSDLLHLVVPSFLEDTFQRGSQDFATFGGRSPIWEYGVETIRSGAPGIFGQGLSNRDASLVVAESLRETFGHVAFSFHNGAIEVVIVYGFVFGTLGLLAMVVAATSLPLQSRSDPGPKESGRTDMLAGLAAGLVVLNFFEAFAAMSFFWAGLILLYALAHKLEVSRPVTAPAP